MFCLQSETHRGREAAHLSLFLRRAMVDFHVYFANAAGGGTTYIVQQGIVCMPDCGAARVSDTQSNPRRSTIELP